MSLGELVARGIGENENRADDSTGVVGYHPARDRYVLIKEMGAPKQVLTETAIRSLQECTAASAHVRWTTFGDQNKDNAHPLGDGDLWIVHNGEIRTDEFTRSFAHFLPGVTTDTKFLLGLIARSQQYSLDRAVAEALSIAAGTAAVGVQRKEEIVIARDRWGNRPAFVGENEGAYMASSESAALEALGASALREVKPGETIALTPRGMAARSFDEGNDSWNGCIFEDIYSRRPDSYFFGRKGYPVRRMLGAALAVEHPCRGADIVVPVPESGVPAAEGYGRAAGIPLELGALLRSHHTRYFIKDKKRRPVILRMKYTVTRGYVEGKRIVVVDDSLIEGETARHITVLLREAGAAQIFFLIASPPIIAPCCYGVPTGHIHRVLLAAQFEFSERIEQVRRWIGADYVGYLSVDGMKRAAVEAPPELSAARSVKHDDFCAACFTGQYTIPGNIPVL